MTEETVSKRALELACREMAHSTFIEGNCGDCIADPTRIYPCGSPECIAAQVAWFEAKAKAKEEVGNGNLCSK